MLLARATGQSVRACLAAARKVLDLKLNDSREVIRSGGEDGLYRVHLSSGDVIECEVVRHGRSAAEVMGCTHG